MDHIDSQFRLNLESWQVLINLGVSAIPGLFMVYCFLIFQEGEKFLFHLALLFLYRYFRLYCGLDASG